MVTVEGTYLPITLSVPALTDAQFEEFCQLYSGYRLEYTAEGDLVITAPTDPDASAPTKVAGEGPVEGFTLDLSAVWNA